jgi:hypothetical protein
MTYSGINASILGRLAANEIPPYKKHTSSPRDDAIISPQHVSRVRLTTADPLDPAASVDLTWRVVSKYHSRP